MRGLLPVIALISTIGLSGCAEVFNVNQTETIQNDKFEKFFAGSSLNIRDTQIKKTLTVKGSLIANNITTNDIAVNGYTTLTNSKVSGKSTFKQGATLTGVTFNDVVTFSGDSLVTNCNFKMPIYIDGVNVKFVNSKGAVIYPMGKNPSDISLYDKSDFTDIYFYARSGSVTMDKSSTILRPITGNQADNEIITTSINYRG